MYASDLDPSFFETEHVFVKHLLFGEFKATERN